MGKTAATRTALQDHALALFLRQGYDETTVAQIAAAAGVSQMTFFRHFPAKSAVVFDDPYDPALAEAVAAQDPHLPARERVRRGLAEAWSSVPEAGQDATRDRIRLIAGHEGLTAGIGANQLRTERALVEALVATGVARLEARVAVGSCLGGVTAALLEWASGPAGQGLAEHMQRALDLLGGLPDAAGKTP